MYEIFLKSHLILALALAGVLWIHIGLTRARAIICLSIGSGLWLLHHAVWLVLLAYRNFGSGPVGRISLEGFPHQSDDTQAIRLSVTLKKPWKILPGQYVYITLPGVARLHGGFLQAHPYSIAWSFKVPDDTSTSIVLLIQQCKGFSNTLTISQSKSSAIVDGPYGGTQTLDGFDKVLFIASGVGITAHLLSIRYLLQAHDDQSARVRRVTLVWFLETAGMILILSKSILSF